LYFVGSYVWIKIIWPGPEIILKKDLEHWIPVLTLINLN
jgi:hypothetical protein